MHTIKRLFHHAATILLHTSFSSGPFSKTIAGRQLILLCHYSSRKRTSVKKKKKPQVASNFLRCEVHKLVKQLNDVYHIHITVNRIEFEAAHTTHASMSSMTNCACAIMVVVAEEGRCYEGMQVGDEKLIYNKLWSNLGKLAIVHEEAKH